MLATGTSYSSTAVMTAPPTWCPCLDMPFSSFFSLLEERLARQQRHHAEAAKAPWKMEQ